MYKLEHICCSAILYITLFRLTIGALYPRRASLFTYFFLAMMMAANAYEIYRAKCPHCGQRLTEDEVCAMDRFICPHCGWDRF